MAKSSFSVNHPIDCACVIHGNGYDWIYVERLYSMLVKLLPQGVNLHVYTEHNRSVPPHMIKHSLIEFPKEITGPKKSWWYKMQLFNPEQFDKQLLYFDLDVVLLRDLSWIFTNSTDYLYGIRDFRYLQRNTVHGLNSSCLWFDVKKYSFLWDEFMKQGPVENSKAFYGDQEFITAKLDYNKRRFFDDKYFESYRWQCLDGGYDFSFRKHRAPNTGAKIANETCVIVFHGKPKPHQITDPAIVKLWC